MYHLVMLNVVKHLFANESALRSVRNGSFNMIVSGCHFLFSQKKVTKEKSRLRRVATKGCAVAGIVLPATRQCRIR
jgi:hypothetical protein